MAPHSTQLRFSTKDLAPGRRVQVWNDVFGCPLARRILCPPWSSDRPFHVAMAGRILGHESSGRPGVCVMRLTVTEGGRARRTRELLRDGHDDVILHIQETGRRMASHLGREATVETGGGLLTTNAEASTITLPNPARFVSVAIPRKTIQPLVPRLEDAFMRPLPPGNDILQLLTKYLDIIDDTDALKTPELETIVATHIHDLCTLAIGATQDMAELARGRGLRAARLRAIKADIAANLGDSSLSASFLARRQGVTPRYIHKLLESEGTTLSQFVRGMRLMHVHRMLTDPRHNHRLISTLVYEAGFGDLSTFNRAFRQKFGITPSDVRSLMQE